METFDQAAYMKDVIALVLKTGSPKGTPVVSILSVTPAGSAAPAATRRSRRLLGMLGFAAAAAVDDSSLQRRHLAQANGTAGVNAETQVRHMQ